MSQAGIKAGIIGGAIGVVLALLQIVPWCGVLACCAFPFLWLGIGAWAAQMGGEEIRTVGQGAGAGGIAAGLGGGVSAVVSGAASAVRYLLGSGLSSFGANYRFTSDQVRILRDWGLDISRFTERPVYAVLGMVCGLAVGIVMAAILGALGGLVFKAMQSQKQSSQTSS